MKLSVFSIAVAIALGSSVAQALSINVTTSEYYDANGDLGSESTQINPTATFFLFNSALGGLMGSPFFGPNSWTAHQVMWDDAVTGSSVNWSGTSASGYYNYDYTLGAGEVAVGLMFNWGAAVDVAILQIFDCSDNVNCTGANNDLAHPGVPGSEMTNGPWPGQHLTFSGIAVVPIPGALWLFGSGLLGLIGIARRKKTA